MNGVEVGTGGGAVHNTFGKIVVLGTSIETTPSPTSCWAKYLADKLGLDFYYNQNGKSAGVVSYARGGGQLCWSGNDYPMYTGSESNPVDITVYDSAILAGFSCSQAERAAAIEYYSDVERWTIGGTYVGLRSADIADAENDHFENLCYDNALLNNLDADLFIFGTHGINDRPSSRLKFTDANGNQCTTATIRNDGLYNFDRRTIFGAYNYVLRALYQANPNAKVAILKELSFMQGMCNARIESLSDQITQVTRRMSIMMIIALLISLNGSYFTIKYLKKTIVKPVVKLASVARDMSWM